MNNTETGHLIFMEDQNDPNVIGVFWGRLGTIDTLMNLYREQRPHAHFATYTTCALGDYASLLPAFDPLRLGGIWHRRGGAIEELLHAIAEHDRAAMAATGGSANPRRNHRRMEAGYGEAAAAY